MNSVALDKEAPRATFHVAPPPPAKPGAWSELAIAIGLALLFNLALLLPFLLQAPEQNPAMREPEAISVDLVPEPKPQPEPEPQPQPEPAASPVPQSPFQFGDDEGGEPGGQGEEKGADQAVAPDAEPEETLQQDRDEKPDPEVPAWAQKFEPGYGLSASPEARPAVQPETARKGGRGDAYGRLIQRRLNSNLVIPPEVAREKVVPPVVYVTIDRSGKMRDVKLIRSSGSSALDGAVLNAIRASFPVPPFPAGIREDSVTLPLTLGFARRD